MRNIRKYLSCARNVSIKDSTKGKLVYVDVLQNMLAPLNYFPQERGLRAIARAERNAVSSLIVITRLARGRA